NRGRICTDYTIKLRLGSAVEAAPLRRVSFSRVADLVARTSLNLKRAGLTPRPYRLQRRQTASEQTRARIVKAALELLREGSVTEFSIDAVARRADVVRMTVYYQFGARRGLLEAVFDELAARGLVPHLRAAYAHADAPQRLDGLVAAFGRFWG